MKKSIAAVALLMIGLMLAACAPDDLDITPSPTATQTPEPTATPLPSPTPNPDADPAEAEAAAAAAAAADVSLLDTILAAIPAQVPAGQVVWRKTSDEYDIREEEGGMIGIVDFNEAGGGAAEVTFGVFDTPESAQAFYDAVAERTRTLEQAESRANFPEPNLFGGGTYGSDAIFRIENYYVRVSVPRFSSTLGDPLNPFGRAALSILSEAAGITIEQ
jgi:hypothetical protein